MAVFPSFYSRACWSYDVFLSFRGQDTRFNITDHLYTALIEAEIHTFRDDEELCRGKEISLELLKAIQESKISVVIFSKGYTSSQWCLDELVKIIECKNTIGQIVLPIFYNVNPSDVRKQSGNLAQVFEKHEQRFNGEMEKVNKWRQALTEAANLSGWDFQNVKNWHESKFIQKVVEDVLSKLNRNYLDVAKYPVGIDSQTKDVIVLLRVVSTNDVRIVGIHGMGGIGKTTIAKAVFNQLCDCFEGSCFLSNIKELSKQPNGLIQLQEQILRDVLKPKSFKIGNVDRGINLIKEKLCCKRVLLVLDDLEQMKQFNVLVGDRNWFGLGSRIIITSRDEHLLTQLEVDSKYQVEELNRNDSLQLFSWHAFKESYPISEYVELSNGVLDYVGGLPLALEVLGSYLYKRSIPEWTSAVEKLRKIPHHQIQKKLRISFDTLDDDKVKDIFLDIVCFFIGMNKDEVMKILDGCGFFPQIGMEVLVQRSLVTIDFINRLKMHDLLRDIGREIIREISPNHPGKRSRLWFHEDVLDVLNKQGETEAVEGLVLDVQASNNVFFNAKPFSKMRYLRLLQINGVHLSGGYQHIFTELRWLCWHKCPLKSLPSNLQLDNLIVLDMQYSNIKEVWTEIKQVQSRYKLPVIFFCGTISELLNGIICEKDGSSLSFHIPRVLEGEIKGLFIWAIYSVYNYGSETTPFVSIRKKSNGVEYIHRSTYLPICLGRQYHYWVSHAPFSLLPFALKGGDELEVCVISDECFNILKCGVCPITENETEIMDDKEAYESFQEYMDNL